VVEKEREGTLGDPVRGITTPFVRSFDTGIPQPTQPPQDTFGRSKSSATPTPSVQDAANAPRPTGRRYLNHFLTPTEIKDTLDSAKLLAAPLPRETDASASSEAQGEAQNLTKEAENKHLIDHETAIAAIARIVDLENGSSKDRLRVNIQRCLDAFGRHNTDTSLPPKPAVGKTLTKKGVIEPMPPREGHKSRAGPDSGSSEVQIAILTAKIRSLANGLEKNGRPDKVNKRNLRLMVHRRQKLLKYLQRKERGGPRWQHCIETLGLLPGTWEGEISL